MQQRYNWMKKMRILVTTYHYKLVWTWLEIAND